MKIKRYEFLDGMRGIAAIMVLTRHTSDFWHFDFFHSYLAVDLFFILSGFVIANSYDNTLTTGQLGLKNFLIARLIRLYPIFLISVIICAGTGAAKIYYGQAEYTGIDLLKTLIFTSLFIPARTIGETGLFSINGPYWSLFYELFTNILYGTIRRQLKDRDILFISILSGMALISAGIINGNLDIGFSWKIGSAAAGLSRAIFGFTFGLLIFRNIESIKKFLPNISSWLALGLAATTLATPQMGRFDIVIDLISVFFIFPIIILNSLEDPHPIHKKILSRLGAASYPIYVLHLPLGQFFELFFKGEVANLAPLSGLTFTALIFYISTTLENKIDTPVRNYLKTKLLKK